MLMQILSLLIDKESMVRNKKVKTIIEFLKEKKVSSLKLLDISKISIIADYFIIVSMPTQRAVDALDNDITEIMAKNKFELRGKEGVHSKWILLDYNDVVIHIFDEDYKEFYNLDKLWADAKNIEI